MLNKKDQEVKYIKEDYLKRIRGFLKSKNRIMFLLFLNISINIALRISDLRSLCFENIIDNRYIEIKETKIRKRNVVVLNSSVQKILKELKIYYRSTGIRAQKNIVKNI